MVEQQLPYNPAVVLLGINLREMERYDHTKTCTHMFIPTLLKIVKNVNNLNTHQLVKR